jgi:peptidyl-prolyl cis-trans isomerase C
MDTGGFHASIVAQPRRAGRASGSLAAALATGAWAGAAALALLAGQPPSAACAEPPRRPPAEPVVGRRAAVPGGEDRVVARVGGQPIYAAEVEQQLRRALGETPVDPAQRPTLWEAARQKLIERQLVLLALAEAGLAASQADIDLALARFEKQLQAQNRTLADHCAAVGLSVEQIRRSLAWSLSWQRYCERYITPQNLEKYFQQHRRQFDGTELRVAQIFWKLPPESEPKARQAAKEAALTQAHEVRAAILAGRQSFAEAARQHSQAPSREGGGDIGWIERHRPMPEPFAQAAFRLAQGEVSEPVETPLGIHLVTVLEEKPGQRTWQEAEAELREAVAVYLFHWLADRQRPKVQIEDVP